MAVDNYLIIGVSPANNEINVVTNSNITFTFSKDIDQTTITSANIILKEVNGEVTPCVFNYVGFTRTLVVKPQASLTADTTYELIVVGGENGIKTVTGDYMSLSRTYQFTTSLTAKLDTPSNVSVVVNNGYVTVQWLPPANHDTATNILYEVQIGTSNLATDPPVWPTTGDINKTSSSVLNIPKQFTQGIYYAYVRAIAGTDITGWSFVEFNIQSQTTGTGTEQPPSSGGGTTTYYSLDIVDTYPKKDSADIIPEKIIILLSDNIDFTTVSSNSVYVVPKIKNGALTVIDFMVDFAPSKAIQATVDAVTGPTNVITLTPAAGSIVSDTGYTVVVRESVKSVNGATIGETYTFSFVSTYSRLYGDVALIRNDIGNTVDNLTDRIIYKFMSDNSEQAYQLVSQTSNFLASDYAGGKAPYYIHQYVRYRTSYDLLLNAQLYSAAGVGDGFTNTVTLGDLTVKKSESGGGANVSSILSELQTKMKIYLDELHGHHNRGYAKPVVAVRGENIEAYPDFLTRADFHDLGA